MLNYLCSKAVSEMFGDIRVMVVPEDESRNPSRQLEQRILPPNKHFWVSRTIETQNQMLHRRASESIVSANIVIAQFARAAPQFTEIQRPVHRCHTQLSQHMNRFSVMIWSRFVALLLGVSVPNKQQRTIY